MPFIILSDSEISIELGLFTYINPKRFLMATKTTSKKTYNSRTSRQTTSKKKVKKETLFDKISKFEVKQFFKGETLQEAVTKFIAAVETEGKEWSSNINQYCNSIGHFIIYDFVICITLYVWCRGTNCISSARV